MLATHIFQGPMWTRTSYLEREKQPGRVTNVQCKVRTSERTRRVVAKRGGTTSKAPEYAAERASGETDSAEPTNPLAERGQVAQKGASCAGRFSLYPGHCRLRILDQLVMTLLCYS